MTVEISYADTLAKHGLPPFDGKITRIRFIAASGDWWVRSWEGWFWLDKSQKAWIYAPLGPP